MKLLDTVLQDSVCQISCNLFTLALEDSHNNNHYRFKYGV